MTCRELIIINGKCYDIKNLGWNPKQCNPQLKEMCEGKDLRAKSFYFIMGYILLTAWVRAMDNLPPKETENDKDDD